MSQEMTTKNEPTEVKEHFSCEEKINAEDFEFEERLAKRNDNKVAIHRDLFVVKHLSSEVTEEELKSHFSICGNVTEVKILKNRNENLPMPYFAFIKYSTNEEAWKAKKELNRKVFMQEEIRIVMPRVWQMKLLLGNDYQPEESQFDEKTAMKDAVKDARQGDFEFDKKSAKKNDKKVAIHRNLFVVKDLSSEVTEEMLKSHFSTCGDVTEVKIFTYSVKAHDNLVYGAFIKYATKKEAVNAMKKLNNKVFLHSKLQLMWPRVWQLKIWLENYDQSAIFEWSNTVPKENLQENDYQPEKKKIKVEVMDSDSEEIQKLKVEEIDLQQGPFDKNVEWPNENLEENDYQPEKKKIKVEESDSDSEEIKKLKDTIEKLKQKKMYFIQLAKKFSDEKQKLEKSNKKLREENSRLRERNLEAGKTEK